MISDDPLSEDINDAPKNTENVEKSQN